MKTRPFILERCFRWARSAAEKPLPEGAPPGFATRVLARLREAQSRDWTLWLLPRAIGVAAVCATALLAFDRTQQPAADERELAGLVMSFALEGQP
ncbi:MAG: hypothetical protein M3463_14100 [Verrucomicrobiota bacterium]|nr:hypothetical protein [Verrucomicrobiota bacterium]